MQIMMGMDGIMEGKTLFLLTAQDMAGPPLRGFQMFSSYPPQCWMVNSHFTDEETEAQRR